MEYIPMKNWLTKNNISKLLTKEQCQLLKYEYDYIYDDIQYPPEYYKLCDNTEVECISGFIFVKKYFDWLIDNIVYEDIECSKDYIIYHAIAILKSNILQSLQIFFCFPLWETADGLNILKSVLKELKEYYNDNKLSEYVSIKFFPYVSNCYVLIPDYQMEWSIEILEEFIDFADNKDLYLSREERDKKEAKRKKEKEELMKIVKEFFNENKNS